LQKNLLQVLCLLYRFPHESPYKQRELSS
jgi:hypothetical protein